MGLDVILGLVGTLGGMVFPSIVDFVKKKWIPASNDTPERTMGTLATTKPETLAPYVQSLALYLEAQVKFFNRDVVGTPSVWVINLRAAIRPMAVILSFAIVGLDMLKQLQLDPATRAGLLTVIGNWIGSRITNGGS
jgi:hypothetical protein